LGQAEGENPPVWPFVCVKRAKMGGGTDKAKIERQKLAAITQKERTSKHLAVCCSVLHRRHEG